uniref:Uncharacterized protein n=1 Tax=Caenorhabditis japonica TaxID=281687 RepID=A0A8R1EDG8_CAEJA
MNCYHFVLLFFFVRAVYGSPVTQEDVATRREGEDINMEATTTLPTFT